MKYPNSLQELIEYFKLLPGIGEKNAERLAFAVFRLFCSASYSTKP